MTDYITQRTLGSTISALSSKDKGDMQNRVNCAGAHVKNNLKATAQDVVVIGGTAAGMAAAVKCKPFANFVNKCVKKVTNPLKKGFEKVTTTQLRRDLKAAAIKFKRLPGATKTAVGAIGLLGGVISGYIARNAIYKAGQIDQKYTDKAAIKEHYKDIL